MDRPRRATRPPVRYEGSSPPKPPPNVASGKKRKNQDTTPTDQVHHLLTSPKSSLTTMDIFELINATSWNMLSLESQSALKALLPPTAFVGFESNISLDHPSVVIDSMVVDERPTDLSSAVVDTSIFTDSHFLAAAHTFQDHIYSNWLSESHAEKVNKYLEGIQKGTLSAPRKDEVWERENAVARPRGNKSNGVLSHTADSTRAGDAAEVKLVTLAKNGILRIGDIIALKRNFSGLDIVVEKDAIIQAIHPKTHVLTVLLQPGTDKYLPVELLSLEPAEPSPPTQIATITSPTQLETVLLDNDGRVEKSRRPHGNAWKCMSVWRWRGDVMADNGNGRWARENHGTLFYLRGTYYHERR